MIRNRKFGNRNYQQLNHCTYTSTQARCGRICFPSEREREVHFLVRRIGGDIRYCSVVKAHISGCLYSPWQTKLQHDYTSCKTRARSQQIKITQKQYQQISCSRLLRRQANPNAKSKEMRACRGKIKKWLWGVDVDYKKSNRRWHLH